MPSVKSRRRSIGNRSPRWRTRTATAIAIISTEQQYPALVVFGTQSKLVWSDAEALAAAALFHSDDLYARLLPAAVAEEQAKSKALKAGC